MAIKITPAVRAQNYLGNCIENEKPQVVPIRTQQVSAPEVKQNDEPCAEGLAKKLFTQAGMFVAFAGGQALASMAGLGKKIDNPSGLIQKLQNMIASDGAKFENTAMSCVGQAKDLIQRQEKTNKLIKGLDKTV